MKEKLKVKGIKREKNKVYLTLLDYKPNEIRKLFKGFRYEVADDENPLVALSFKKNDDNKLTKILNEKIEFIKELESRFKQFSLISTLDELEIYPEVEEVDSIAAPIENALTRFGENFKWYTGVSTRPRTMRPREFTKKFRSFAKNKNADSFFLEGENISLGFKGNKFTLSGQSIRPVRKFFMKNG